MNRFCSQRWACAALMFLLVGVAAPAAFAQDPLSAVASANAGHQTSHLQVIGAYRPVDPTRKVTSASEKSQMPTAQHGLDLYLNVQGSTIPVTYGQVFAVFRIVAPPSSLDSPGLTLKVGEVQILSIQGPLAIGKVIAGPDAATQPYLRTPGILVGDFIDPAKPIAKKSMAGAPKSSKRQRGAKRGGKRGVKKIVMGGAKQGPAKMGTTEPCPTPVEGEPSSEPTTKPASVFSPPTVEANGGDPDDFRSWDSHPIDF